MNKFCLLYCNKNQYEMFEEFAFKYARVDFSEVDILVFDDNSVPEQKSILTALCKKYNNIKWINPSVEQDSIAPVITSIKACSNYIDDNNLTYDWMLFFENDCIPFQQNFWHKLSEFISTNNSWLHNKVGLLGFNSYQYYEKGKIKTPGNPVPGRGCLVNNILNPPYSGWYKDLPEDYYNIDHFVVEVPNWQSMAINKPLFDKFIQIDKRYDNRLLNGDDIAHQFMLYNIFNICIPGLAVCHDGDNKLKNKINIMKSSSYSRSENSHNIFEDRWGWKWGKRNLNLRAQFNNALENSDFYKNTIQEKLFKLSVEDGPKRVHDFE